MSERMEWELVPLVKEDKRTLVEELAAEVLRLDAMLEMDPRNMSREDQELLVSLQQRMSECVISPCEGAGAPHLSTRDNWREEALEAFAECETGDALSQEEFLLYLGRQHDCSRCEGASANPGVSGLPCDYDLTPMRELLPDDSILEQTQFELEPAEMLRLAEELADRIARQNFATPTDPKAQAYLLDAVRFLRFWSAQGYGVAPAYARSS